MPMSQSRFALNADIVRKDVASNLTSYKHVEVRTGFRDVASTCHATFDKRSHMASSAVLSPPAVFL